MKEVIREERADKRLSAKEVTRELVRQSVVAIIGFVMSRGTVFGGILPFGNAFVAAVPKEYLAMSAFGCCLATVIPASGGNVFRYLGGLFAIVSIKALLALTTKYENNPLLCGGVAGLVTVATGLVATVNDPKGSIMAVAEAVLAFSGAFFLKGATKTLKSPSNLGRESTACLIICGGILLVGAISIAPGGISLGRVLAMTFILLISRFGHASAGAICGIAAGMAAALASGSGAAVLVFSLGGLVSGVFASMGKYAQIAALAVSCLVGSAVAQNLTLTVGLFIETLFGSAIFLVVPKSVAMKISRLFSPAAAITSADGMKKTITMRLKKASGALCDVSETVDKVAGELARINTPTFEGVLCGIEKDACTGCSLSVHCWEAKKTETVSAVMDMIKAVREGEKVEEAAGEDFRSHCLRPARFASAVAVHYGDYASRMAAENRICDLRSVVSEQFDGISDMLLDMAEELEREEAFDYKLAENILDALQNMEIQATECSCRVDKYGRMSVEIIANTLKGQSYNRMKLLRQVEVCCDRDFEPPTLTYNKGKVFISLTERAEFTVKFGASQIACSPSGICGDAFSFFTDGRGRAFAVISDGMGSGGRAAVDGAMASGLITRLLKAGFGYDSSLNILNSAMLFKSSDESLATVDLACIDLYSGRTDLLKAGAAATVLRRGGKCGVAESTSLPAGILREVGFDKATVKLRHRDLLLMMSDGVTADGTDWICAELEAFEDGTADELADKIARGAARRRANDRADDITVLAAIVERKE